MNSRIEFGRKITQLVERLPLFPRDIDRLLATALQPTEDNAEIVQLLEKDSELWTELLHLASSYYGIAEKAETVEDAVRRIGIQPLVQLIGVSYARKAIREEFASLKYLNEYFDHSEHISISCHILAEISDMPRNQRQMYAVAGLIHDIGRLAVMVASNRTSAHVLGTLWDKMASVVHDERASSGTNHCEVGMQICRRWNFSPVIQEGVLRHHTPLTNGDFSFPGALIFVAHFLSASDPSGEIVSSLSAGEILPNLKLTLDDFDKARHIYESRTRNNVQ
jgi:HD-like signal output (HDOD) protein